MRTRRGLGLCASCCLAVVVGLGCESVRRGANPDLPLWTKRPGGVLSVTNQETLTIEGRNPGEAFEKGRPCLDPPRRRMFVGSSDGGLYALRVEDASILWRFETAGAVQSEPVYDAWENAVYFGSDDGALYKVHADTGRLIWRFMSNAEVERAVVFNGSLLYFANANDTFVAVDRTTGELKWTQHRPAVGGMSISGYAGPTFWNGKVYAAYSDGHVVAYGGRNGEEAWTPVDLAAEAEQASGYQVPKYFDVDTTPLAATIAAGPVVIVGSYSGGVYALDAETGARVWANERATGVTSLTMWTQPAHRPRDGGPVVPARRVLLAASGTTGLWGLDPDEGAEIWRRSLPEGGVTTPVPIAGALLVSSTRYGLFLFSPLDGGVIDGLSLGSGISMPAAAYGRRAFVVTNGGTLVSLQVQPPI